MKFVLRNKLLASVIVIMAVGSVAFYTQTQPDIPSLILNARIIIPFDSSSPYYWWLSGQELMMFRSPANQDYTLVKHNIDTNVDTPLSALTELYQRSHGKPETIRVTILGDWILWTGDGNTTWVSTPDGLKHYKVQENGPRINVWKCNGEGWYALDASMDMVQQMFEHQVSNPTKKTRYVVLSYPFPNNPKKINIAQLTATMDDKLLIPLWPNGKGNLDRAEIMSSGFVANPMGAKQLKFSAPHENSRGELAFSAFSDKMAWQLDFLLPRPKFFHDMGIGNSGKHSTGFWITNQKTGVISALGRVDVDANDPSTVPANVQFTPSGARLSFIYKNALWSVPTE